MFPSLDALVSHYKLAPESSGIYVTQAAPNNKPVGCFVIMYL